MHQTEFSLFINMANTIKLVHFINILAWLQLVTLATAQSFGTTFASGIPSGVVTFSEISETSGLGASRQHPGYFYTHNDRHGDAKIYVINGTGHLQAQIYLQGEVTHYDWEDMAVGPCARGSNVSCIYIGDFGDGNSNNAKNDIYRIREPDTISDQVITLTIDNKLKFDWDRHDCDTLLVDHNANVYIISKEKHSHGVFAMVPPAAWGLDTRVDIVSTVKIHIDSDHPGPLGGDISLNGNEILLKTHGSVYYWDTAGTYDYQAVLQTPGTKLPYTHERQGEAICWDSAGRDYYTLSEGKNEPFYHYSRV